MGLLKILLKAGGKSAIKKVAAYGGPIVMSAVVIAVDGADVAVDICTGNFLSAGLGVVGMVADVCTGGYSSEIVKATAGVVKDAAKAGVREVAKETLKEGAKETAKETTKSTMKVLGKEALKQIVGGIRQLI